MELACQCPAVVCCRCTPTQKAQIVRLLQERTGKLTCAVGELKMQTVKLSTGFLFSIFYCGFLTLNNVSTFQSQSCVTVFTALTSTPSQSVHTPPHLVECWSFFYYEWFINRLQCYHELPKCYFTPFYLPQPLSGKFQADISPSFLWHVSLIHVHNTLTNSLYWVTRWCGSWHFHGVCFLLGDGGNDVSMIQEADCGVGVEGKVRLSPSQRLSLTCHSHRFSLCASCQDLSHVQRHVDGRAHRWFLFVRIYCQGKGNKDYRMLWCFSKSKSLSSACLLHKISYQDGWFARTWSYDVTLQGFVRH